MHKFIKICFKTQFFEKRIEVACWNYVILKTLPLFVAILAPLGADYMEIFILG